MVNLTFCLPEMIMINDDCPVKLSLSRSEVAHSSRGLGHLPLKEEITGSNPVCATKQNFGKVALFSLTTNS